MPLYVKLLVWTVLGLLYSIFYLGWIFINQEGHDLEAFSLIILMIQGVGPKTGHKLKLLSYQQAVIVTASLTILVVTVLIVAISKSKKRRYRTAKHELPILSYISSHWVFTIVGLVIALGAIWKVLEMVTATVNRNTVGLLFLIGLLGWYLIISKPKLSRILLFRIFMITIILSIPWEFMREYEEKVATQATIRLSGFPPECQRSKLPIMSLAASFFKETFTWKGDTTCLEYHKALLMQPIWQVLPSKVFTAVLVKTIVGPLEFVAEKIGVCYRSIFLSIPAQYQWLVIVQMSVLAFGAIFICFYFRQHSRLLSDSISERYYFDVDNSIGKHPQSTSSLSITNR